jgi:hypothetical protein
MRLNLWDFDDTLAASDDVIERLSKAHPEIAYRDWWQDPKLSTLAALETRPFPTMWATLLRTPGRHVLFSGRVPEAVEAWVEAYRDDPEIGAAVARLEGAIPVPHFRRAGERIPEVKVRLVRAMLDDGERDIHVYDDHADLPALLAAGAPEATMHRAAHGHLLNGRGCRCVAHRREAS